MINTWGIKEGRDNSKSAKALLELEKKLKKLDKKHEI
jgi:hypothetical protein